MPDNITLNNDEKQISYIQNTNIINVENNDVWMRPWNLESFDDLYNRDERFFSIIIKGALSWLNKNIVMYNKSINHFVFNTGSSYLYIESNGYEYSWSETTGEDSMYMHMPRCVVTIGSINIPTEELSQRYSRGFYERRSGNMIKGYTAEIQRLPVELELTLKYVLSNFNESIILVQEIIDKIVFQKYFNITYLGNIIQCSLEFPTDFTINLNEIDMESTEKNMKTIEISIKLCTNYPIIDERTEQNTDKIIQNFNTEINIHDNDKTVDHVDNGI